MPFFLSVLTLTHAASNTRTYSQHTVTFFQGAGKGSHSWSEELESGLGPAGSEYTQNSAATKPTVPSFTQGTLRIIQVCKFLNCHNNWTKIFATK